MLIQTRKGSATQMKGKAMRAFLPLFLCAITFGAAGAQAEDRPVIYELFTSQGCSSCPPADRVAQTLADNPNTLVLSYHVSYWDRLGWKDPFSSAAATNRQYAYASAMGTTRVYTPQGVVQGEHDVVGSRAGKVRSAISKARHGEWVKASLARQGNAIEARLPSYNGKPAELFVVGYAKHTGNAVPRGENAGRNLTHRNSVTEIQSLGRWDGSEQTLRFALEDTRSEGAALIIQHRGNRAILGGGWL